MVSTNWIILLKMDSSSPAVFTEIIPSADVISEREVETPFVMSHHTDPPSAVGVDETDFNAAGYNPNHAGKRCLCCCCHGPDEIMSPFPMFGGRGSRCMIACCMCLVVIIVLFVVCIVIAIVFGLRHFAAKLLSDIWPMVYCIVVDLYISVLVI